MPHWKNNNAVESLSVISVEIKADLIGGSSLKRPFDSKTGSQKAINIIVMLWSSSLRFRAFTPHVRNFYKASAENFVWVL